MSYFKCEKCGKQVSVSRLDYASNYNNRCSNCNYIVASGEYEKNIDGGTTIFSDVGFNLGHKVMFEALLRFYKEQNPKEFVSALTPEAMPNFIKNYKNHSGFNKLFWADISTQPPIKIEQAIHYNFAQECSAIAKQGYYPKWEKKQPITDINIDKPFIVLHLRNIDNNKAKNVTAKELAEIDLVLANTRCYLVGNDNIFDSERDLFDLDFCYDLRSKLTLDQIAWLCGHENCIATVGKDSGILHLAAAAGSKVVGYGYKSKYWHPKTTSDKVKAFSNTEKGFDGFIECLKTINGKK